jgi:hypothetical protein
MCAATAALLGAMLHPLWFYARKRKQPSCYTSLALELWVYVQNKSSSPEVVYRFDTPLAQLCKHGMCCCRALPSPNDQRPRPSLSFVQTCHAPLLLAIGVVPICVSRNEKHFSLFLTAFSIDVLVDGIQVHKVGAASQSKSKQDT